VRAYLVVAAGVGELRDTCSELLPNIRTGRLCNDLLALIYRRVEEFVQDGLRLRVRVERLGGIGRLRIQRRHELLIVARCIDDWVRSCGRDPNSRGQRRRQTAPTARTSLVDDALTISYPSNRWIRANRPLRAL